MINLPFEDAKTGLLKLKETKVFKEKKLIQYQRIKGPALVVMNGSTIVVEDGWECLKNKEDNFELFFQENQEKGDN